MSPKAARLRKKWQSLWDGSPTSKEVESLAKKVGRKKRKGSGGDRFWVSLLFPELTGVTIPFHSRSMPLGTRKAILKELWKDIQLLEEMEWEARGDESE